MGSRAEMTDDEVFVADVPGHASAGASEEFVVLVAPFKMRIRSATFVPKTTVTATATNYMDLRLRNRGAAGSGDVEVARRSYNTGGLGNTTAFTAGAVTVTATAADQVLNAGDVLTLEKLHTGTGMVLPAGTLTVHARPL